MENELKRYGVSVAGIQETKWFGRGVWPAAEGFTFFHSGRPLPVSGADAVRNEGVVGILLDPQATAAWRNAGEVWEAVSSRIVTARLKWVSKGQQRHGVSREIPSIALSVVCVKAQFCSDWQHTLGRIPQSDILVVLGD